MEENDDGSHKKENENDSQKKENDDVSQMKGRKHGSQKYLVGIIVLAVLLIISLFIHAYVFYRNRQLKPLKGNVENITDISRTAVSDYERMDNERSTNTTLKMDKIK